MPETAADDDLDAVAARLYALVPDEFVPARDDAVAAAKERGDRDLARAIGRLRRPNRAAWLSNLLARQRGEQLDALLTLADDLASAQRTLDGDALRALSSQRHRLVAAMAREAGRLAQAAGEPVGDGLLRELAGILEAALADPGVAAEVRSGRLTRTLTYSGFGPDAMPPPPGPRTSDLRSPAPPAAPDSTADDSTAHDSTAPPGPETGGGTRPPAAAELEQRGRIQRERQERERQEREQQERGRRERDLSAAERDETAARDRQDVDDAARDDTEAAHADARERVSALTTELEAARGRERDTAARARAAATTAKDSARAAQAAAARATRARARLDELTRPD